MEKSFKSWQNFIIGLLIGIIGGGFIVWLEMKDANRNFLSQILYELNTLKLEKKIAEDEHQKEKTSGAKGQKSTNRQSKLSKNDSVPDKAISPDSVNIPVIDNDSVASSTSIKILDSLQVDSGLLSSENIVVKKDRLIFSTNLKLKIKDDSGNAGVPKDSLIGEISGVHREDDKKEYSVEFWESPINYKGYKMGNKKIILFGIGEEFESISLFQVDKKIYLKYYDLVFQLDPTYNFEPLKKVNDKTLLARME